MNRINIIETAKELISLARSSKFNECREGPVLGKGAQLVFEGDMKYVRLAGDQSQGFELSPDITAEDVLSALAANSNFTIHIT